MKKILLLSTLFAAALLIDKPASAQFQASVNIGVQPEWGPSGYDYAENYYLPDVEAYYCVPRHQFVYNDGGNWVYASSLPGRYSNYDLYSGYKVVMNERNPWLHFYNHRAQYAGYRFRHDQLVLRDNRSYGRRGYGRPVFDNRYNAGREYGDNNRHNEYRQDGGRGNERGGGYDNDRRHNDNHGDHGRGRW